MPRLEEPGLAAEDVASLAGLELDGQAFELVRGRGRLLGPPCEAARVAEVADGDEERGEDAEDDRGEQRAREEQPGGEAGSLPAPRGRIAPVHTIQFSA